MSKPIEAVYEEGRLRPLEPVPLNEGDHVRLELKLVPDNAGENLAALERPGPQMARALEEIAFSDPPTQIGDPVEWQREIRRDRRLPGRDD